MDVSKYPYPKRYTLYAGLEPCIMCMGILVMGHIRNVVIAAKKLLKEGFFAQKPLGEITAEEVFDELIERFCCE